MYHTRLVVICESDFSEILMAEVAETGFDTFMETDKGFEAFVEQENFNKQQLEEIRERYNKQTTILFYQDRIQKKNWNEEWEKSYEPVIVDDQCIIRASFHTPLKKYPYDIVITPKMSFGTGHHATTYLMIKNQLEIDHINMRVMDAGCGTAVLSVMAAKRGATFVDGFDIDDWSIENGKENAEINNCQNIRVRKGKINELKFEEPFHIILANINKNILMMEMPYYATYLLSGGQLLLSGFYENDIPDLVMRAEKEGLTKVSHTVHQTWAALLLKKQ
jgi:ribosomal protein L11 methyltransferase